LSHSNVRSQSAPPRLHFRLPPEASHLLRARERLRDYLRLYCDEQRVIDDLVLCVEEAATNAIRHSGTTQDIEITLEVEVERLVASVKDRGRGFEVATFDPDQTPDPLEDHGRGLFIIAALMDALELRVDGGLEVRMTRKARCRRGEAVLESGLGEPGAAGAAAGHGESRLRAMLEEIDEAFLALDWEYRYVHVNEAMLRFTQTSRDELLGRVLWEVFPQLQGSPLQEHYRRAMELGIPSIFEHRGVVTNDWIEVRVYPTSVGVSAYYRDINERKRSEMERDEYLSALREAEAKSHDLIRYAPTGIFEIDLRGLRFRTVNDAMCELSGYSRDELLAMEPSALLDAESQAVLAERIRRGLAGEAIPDSVEYRFRRKDGSLRDIVLNRTFTGTDGVVDGALVVGYDITERKQAEREREGLIEELSRSGEHNRFLADVLENAAMPFAVRKPDGALILFNRAFAELTGYSREELVEGAETLARGLTPPEWWEFEAPLLAEAVAERRPARYEKEYARKDGRRVPIEVFAQPVFDEAGALTGYRSFLTDISERRQAQAAQREGEERFRALFESTTEGIALHEVVYDDGQAVDYRIIDVNPSFESQTGLPAHEARGRLASELYGTGEAPYLAEYARVAASGEPYAFEAYFPPMRRHFRITATSPGRGRFATVFEDITEGKRIEETLRASEEAAHAAEAETRRLLDESQDQAGAIAERACLAEALNRVNRLVHSTVDFDEIMKHALDEGVRALAGDAGAIEMREDSRWVVRYQSGLSAEDVGVALSGLDTPSATRAMSSKEPLAIADLRPDPKTNVGFVRAHRLRSVLAVPLIVKESVIGRLLVYGRQVHRFNEAEVDFGRKLSATLSLAIENARLYEAQAEAQRRTERELETTSLLLEAATVATSWTDLDRMLESLGDLLLRGTDHSRVLLELWDEQRREVEIAVSRGAQATARQRFRFAEISDGAKEVITTWKTVVIDYATTGLPVSQQGYVDEHAFLLMLVVPVVYRERLVGLITVDQPGEARPFSAQEIQLVEAIAGQAAAAIENTRLYGEAVERERLSAALNEIATSIATLLDYHDVLTAVVGQTGAALGAESSAICSLAASELVPTHLWRLPVESLGVPIPRASTPYVDVAVAERRVVAVDDCETDPRVHLQLQHEWGVRSVMAAPLVTRDEVVGAMLFNYHSAPHTFAPFEVEFVDRAAALISGVLESAELYGALQSQSGRLQAQSDELQTQNAKLQTQNEKLQAQSEELQAQSERLQAQGEELQAQGEELQVQNDELLVQRRLADSEMRNANLLLKSAKLLAGGLDLGIVLENLAIIVLEALPHSRVTVQLWDAASRTLTIAASHGQRPAEPGTTIAFEQTSSAFRDMLARRSTIVTDFDVLPAEARGRVDEFASRFHLAIPLVGGGELLGALVVDDPGERRPFAAREVALLEAIAAQAGIALENARVFEAQRHIARTLQENFIHELPTVPGLDLGVVTTTASEPELVGGDFSDAFVLDDTHVVALIGDVAGKGIRAAGLTETVRSKMRAFASVDPSPAFILEKTNELLLRFDPDDPHVTACCSVLDPRTGVLSYASAGHPAPVHLSARSCLSLDVAFGPPLGSFVRPYTNAQATLLPGDYLVFYTDGVSEARRGDELLGERRLLEIVDGLRGRSAQEVAEGVRDAVLDFAGRLRDDLQVVVLRLV